MAFDKYFDSRPELALKHIKKILEILVIDSSNSGLFFYSLRPKETLYRARKISEKELEEKCGDLEEIPMFHLPLNQREKVKSYRYSLAGCPSLYFGSKPKICFKEIGETKTDKLYCSKFQATVVDYKIFKSTDIILLDLRNWLPEFQPNLPQTENDEKILHQFLCLWPLIAACSVRVNKPDEYFKPEYLIPQLVYQSIKEVKMDSQNYITRKLDGIIYSSTKLDAFNPKTDYNIAIPSSVSNEENLRESFRQSNPIHLGKIPEGEWESINFGEMKPVR